MRSSGSSALLGAFQGLRISPATPLRPSVSTIISTAGPSRTSPVLPAAIANGRPFSSTTAKLSWLEPLLDRKKKMMKGRPRVATGGSVKGTTVIWGDYGLRMKDHHRRIAAKNLKLAEDVIKQRLRGQRYRLYKRVACNVGVFTSGNEHRMGKGKGSFDHWAARIAVSQIIFEISGALHEQVIRDAFRLAASKLPGMYEFVKKGEPPMTGLVKMEPGVTLDSLKQPWKKIQAPEPPAEPAASASPTTAPS